jgi:DNA-nicking Smr family endonuclease
VKAAPEKPRPARLRRLTDEEIELWIAVAKSVAQRHGATLPSRAAKPLAPAPTPAPPRPSALAAKPKHAPPLPPPLQPFDSRLRKRVAQGRSAVDSALDLHGMNQIEAHRALRDYLGRAQAQGQKLVIVVTGKGGPKGREPAAPFDEPGVLRRLTPHWLRAPDMRSIVLSFEEAGRAHGGSGALYVRLRRSDR